MTTNNTAKKHHLLSIDSKTTEKSSPFFQISDFNAERSEHLPELKLARKKLEGSSTAVFCVFVTMYGTRHIKVHCSALSQGLSSNRTNRNCHVFQHCYCYSFALSGDTTRAKKANTEPGWYGPKCWDAIKERRRVKTWQPVASFKSRFLLPELHMCRNVESEEPDHCPTVLTAWQQQNWTGSQRKQDRRDDCLYFFLSKANQTHRFSCHYGVPMRFLGVNLPTVPYSEQMNGWSITAVQQTI